MPKLEGVALHCGAHVTVEMFREAGPIRFRRRGVEIPARVANVASTDRATTLAAGGERIGLVEHLLAALRVAGHYSGVLIEVDADELPILDGSSLPWFEAVAELGAPDSAPPPLLVSRTVSVTSGSSTATLEPGAESLTYQIDFAHPAIGAQTWSGGPGHYHDLLGARTFGFMNEVEELHRRGLAKGAALEHAIVFADEGPLRPLRWVDEPVRHKALDALGDLSLLGRPLVGSAHIVRGSHTLHHLLMKSLVAAEGLSDEGPLA